MNNLFSYDSKVMQALMFVGDMIILNVLFLLCCIPIVTIGAAQTGLYSGIRVLMDKEDDSSPAAAFFKGFGNGFFKITLVWMLYLVLFVLLLLNLVPVFASIEGMPEFITAYADVAHAPVALTLIGLILCALLHNLTILFHARFNCSIFQFFRNSVLLILAHPLRCILATVAIWVPLLIFAFDYYSFMAITPVFLAVGFCGLFMFSFSLTNKPFKELIARFSGNPDEPEKAAVEPEEETV